MDEGCRGVWERESEYEVAGCCRSQSVPDIAALQVAGSRDEHCAIPA